MPLLPWLLVSTAHAEPAWKVMRSDEARASSHLRSNWNKFEENYHPTYVLDENPATAWVEGAEGEGVGEYIDLPLSAVTAARAVRVRIRNGYQKSEALLVANGAPRDVMIDVRWRDGTVATTRATLERRMGWQEVVVPLTGEATHLDAVRLRIVSVTSGKTYKDTCVSDMLVEVDHDGVYVPAVEAAKLDAAKEWIASRLARAKEFAATAATSPIAFTEIKCSQSPIRPDEAEARLAAVRPQAIRAGGGKGWYRADVKTFPIPESLPSTLEYLLRFVAVDRVALFEATEQSTYTQAPANQFEKRLWDGRTWSPLKLVGTPTAPELGWIRSHSVFHERTLVTEDIDWTLVWEGGRLIRILRLERSTEDHTMNMDVVPNPRPPPDQGRAEELVEIRWDALGRVAGWDIVGAGVHTSECDPDSTDPAERCTYAEHWICAGL